MTRIEPKAHPRVCGENQQVSSRPRAAYGSSPRVRGKLHAGEDHSGEDRLIPACAGKTRPVPARRGAGGAHPRVCGENADGAITALSIGGSSPRVRGKRRFDRRRADAHWLIPACAGKTWHRGSSAPCRGAHPRVCGENEFSGFRINLSLGSSPRVRGKPEFKREKFACVRLIPACAGKTSGAFPRGKQIRAHPRVCGENLEGVADQLLHLGSSPRVRGKHRGKI